MAEAPEYVLRISGLTIDKLGVKLYDKASAVVAELVANAYDADAETVTVRLPLGVALAKKTIEQDHEADDGKPPPRRYEQHKYSIIEVEDDGHGMNPEEARTHFLVVGQDRRRAEKNGGDRGRSSDQ